MACCGSYLEHCIEIHGTCALDTVLFIDPNSHGVFVDKVSSLDDVKTNSQTDSNAAKQMALDHLGVIAAKIRTSVLKFQRDAGHSKAKKSLRPLDEVSGFLGEVGSVSCSIKPLSRLCPASV